jgi:hypothetical protein
VYVPIWPDMSGGYRLPWSDIDSSISHLAILHISKNNMPITYSHLIPPSNAIEAHYKRCPSSEDAIRHLYKNLFFSPSAGRTLCRRTPCQCPKLRRLTDIIRRLKFSGRLIHYTIYSFFWSLPRP